MSAYHFHARRGVFSGTFGSRYNVTHDARPKVFGLPGTSPGPPNPAIVHERPALCNLRAILVGEVITLSRNVSPVVVASTHSHFILPQHDRCALHPCGRYVVRWDHAAPS